MYLSFFAFNQPIHIEFHNSISFKCLKQCLYFYLYFSYFNLMNYRNTISIIYSKQVYLSFYLQNKTCILIHITTNAVSFGDLNSSYYKNIFKYLSNKYLILFSKNTFSGQRSLQLCSMILLFVLPYCFTYFWFSYYLAFSSKYLFFLIRVIHTLTRIYYITFPKYICGNQLFRNYI